jgi:antitoxin (DNA-binding transcriptional repressor) of toxin-antitoxin stability system
MREIDVSEAKSTFDALLDLVEQGEEIVITRHGRAIARLVREHAAPGHEELAVRRQTSFVTRKA